MFTSLTQRSPDGWNYNDVQLVNDYGIALYRIIRFLKNGMFPPNGPSHISLEYCNVKQTVATTFGTNFETRHKIIYRFRLGSSRTKMQFPLQRHRCPVFPATTFNASQTISRNIKIIKMFLNFSRIIWLTLNAVSGYIRFLSPKFNHEYFLIFDSFEKVGFERWMLILPQFLKHIFDLQRVRSVLKFFWRRQLSTPSH